MVNVNIYMKDGSVFRKDAVDISEEPLRLVVQDDEGYSVIPLASINYYDIEQVV